MFRLEQAVTPMEQMNDKWSVLRTANDFYAGFLPTALAAAFISPLFFANRLYEGDVIILVGALVTFPIALIATMLLLKVESIKRSRMGRWAVALFPLLWLLPVFGAFTTLAVE